ncbi:membrane protein [Clostridia bacterium]|nr:membrane protein [Clostridia bacterium]
MLTVQFTRTLPQVTEYDVIVCGGGPAGCAAATASARHGAKTLLLESSGCLGGMGTIGLVSAWCPFSDKEKLLYRGIAQEVFDSTKSLMKHINPTALDWVAIDPEALKRVYDDLVEGSGADILFGSSVCSLALDGDSIEYIVVNNKSGLTAYTAKVFIDCTGDADLVAFAGLSFDIGSDDDHELQPASLCFSITNVDEYHYAAGPKMHSSIIDCPVYDIVNSDKYPQVTDGHSCNGLIGPRTVAFNAGHLWGVDPTDPLSVSRAMIQGRRLAHQFQQGLAEFYPSAFAAGFLCATASAMGIRESRRVIGDYCITIEDYVARRSFPDEIGRNCYYIDIHHTAAEREAWNTGAKNDQSDARPYEKGESHGIPYRSLIPKGLTNVLTAGKNISCDREVQGSVRVMPPCLVTGQAAGTAAAMAAKSNAGVREVDTDVLRSELRDNGAYFL